MRKYSAEALNNPGLGGLAHGGTAESKRQVDLLIATSYPGNSMAAQKGGLRKL